MMSYVSWPTQYSSIRLGKVGLECSMQVTLHIPITGAPTQKIAWDISRLIPDLYFTATLESGLGITATVFKSLINPCRIRDIRRHF